MQSKSGAPCDDWWDSQISAGESGSLRGRGYWVGLFDIQHVCGHRLGIHMALPAGVPRTLMVVLASLAVVT